MLSSWRQETHCPQQLSAGMSSRDGYPPALRTTSLPVPTRNNPGWFASYTSRFSAQRNAEDGFYLSARRKSRGRAGKFAPLPGGVGGGSGRRGTFRYLELQLLRRYNQCAPRLRQKCSNCRTLMLALEPGCAGWETPLAQYAGGRPAVQCWPSPDVRPPLPHSTPGVPHTQSTCTHCPRQSRGGWVPRSTVTGPCGVSPTKASVIRGFRTRLPVGFSMV